jgi:archaellum component FlaD/FlaE
MLGQLVKVILLYNIRILFDFVPQLGEVQSYNVFLSLRKPLESALLLSLVYILKCKTKHIDSVVLDEIRMMRRLVAQSVF